MIVLLILEICVWMFIFMDRSEKEWRRSYSGKRYFGNIT